MKLLMIDNYDSFTYNIVQYFGELGAQVTTLRNDEVTIDELDQQFKDKKFERLCISPGPCSPNEAGISVAAIKHFAGKIIRAQELMHGKTSVITTTQEGVFKDLPKQFTVNRYHSLAIEPGTCPKELAVTARTDDGEIMGVRHTGYAHAVRIEGVQFHPESILTEHGHAMLKNFLL
jgi:anthranilate synthase component II